MAATLLNQMEMEAAMHDAEIEFHKLMEADGGRADVAAMPKAGRIVCDALIEDFSQTLTARRSLPSFPRVHFDIVNNLQFQAVAFGSPRQYYIGFFAGAYRILELLFHRALSHPDIVPEIGNAKAETAPPVVSITSSWSLMEKSIVPCVPKDPDRKEYAGVLTDLACTFLFNHELGHILAGHVDLWMNTTSARYLPEVGARPIDPETAQLLQTLEFDADSYAGLNLIYNIRKKWEAGIQPDIIASGRTGLEQYFFNAGFAVGMLVHYLGDELLGESDLTKMSHPPYRFRQFTIGGTGGTYCLERWSEEMWTLHGKNSGAGGVAAEHAFMQLTGQPPPIGFLQELESGAYSDYGDEIKRYYDEVLAAQLAPYSYLPKLKKEQEASS